MCIGCEGELGMCVGTVGDAGEGKEADRNSVRRHSSALQGTLGGAHFYPPSHGEGEGVWRWGWERGAIQRDAEVLIPQREGTQWEHQSGRKGGGAM